MSRDFGGSLRETIKEFIRSKTLQGYRNKFLKLEKKIKIKEGDGLKERLAKFAHKQWSGWMNYMFEKSVKNSDGTITIPKWAVDRWSRQAGTAYKDLPEEEKENDRLEAEGMILTMKKMFKGR